MSNNRTRGVNYFEVR